MRLISAILLATALTMLGPSRGLCSEEWSFEAFQPIWSFSDLSLSRVTVLVYGEGDVGTVAVLATCDSNQVLTQYGPQQRNAAFDVGLRTEVTFNSNREPPLFGDTLRVTLRATRPPSDLGDFSFETIVAATVQCVLLNAAQTPEIKYVAVRVAGDAADEKYGGVFRTASFRNGPKKRVFSPPE
jgi:hypothetical protein